MKVIKTNKLFQSDLVKEALRESLVKLSPVTMFRNPVMFTVWVGTLVMIGVCVWIISGEANQGSLVYNLIVTAILFITLLFANFAEAIAEARGKAQANSLRKTREETPAQLVGADNKLITVNSSELKKGDVFLCVAGDIIPTDGEIIEGLATIDESAITGESAPVIREAGGDKSSVTGGTKILSDKIKILVTTEANIIFHERNIYVIKPAISKIANIKDSIRLLTK